eukprot:8509428-Alexandrium_andersonii.AAC.1
MAVRVPVRASAGAWLRLRVHLRARVHSCGCEDVRVCWCAGVQVCARGCARVRVRKCAGAG